MYKSCTYCGKIHDSKYDCGCKPKKKKRFSDKDSFRGSGEWKRKRKEIKELDKCLCVVCLIMEKRITINNLSVHHIESLEDAYELRVDDDNLITVCDYHHEEAEKGNISKQTLRELIKKHRKTR